MPHPRRPRRSSSGVALVAALAAHGGLLAVVDRPEARHLGEVMGRDLAVGQAAPIALVITDESAVGRPPPSAVGRPPPSIDGGADRLAFGASHPLPAAPFDAPGTQAAAPGAGARGGSTRVTGRHDRTTLPHEIWNHPDRYQLHRRDRRTTRSPEALERAERVGAGARSSRGPGAALEATGAPHALHRGERGGSAFMPRAWRDLDPRFDLRPPTSASRARRGDVVPTSDRAMKERGPDASEARARGQASDAVDAAGYSDATAPSVLELSSPAASGTDDGVRGPRGHALADRSSSRRGTSATTAPLPADGPLAATRAERDDPYFRRMYERVDRLVEYPRDLALGLEQGEVVVEMTLEADGRIVALAVTKPSGFEGFDREVARAMRAAAPFGPVPVTVRGRASRLRVEAPYTFSNPLIR